MAARRRTNEPAETIGLSMLVREAAYGRAFDRLARQLSEWLAIRSDDAGARLALSGVMLLSGDRTLGLEVQAMALAQTRVYRRVFGNGRGLRVLAFLAPGDLATNAPLDYLLEASNVDLMMVYCDGTEPVFEALPDHDIAFLAINRSEETADLLAQLSETLDDWPRPVMNGHPDRIAALSRDRLFAMLAGHRRLIFPDIRRMSRSRLLAASRSTSAAAWDGPAFPVVVRPALPGVEAEKIDDLRDLEAYLLRAPDADIEVTAFYDYSGSDGLFRKFRVAFIDGQPHLARASVSYNWRAPYISLSEENFAPGERVEEANLTSSFNATFAVRHRAAFDSIVEAAQLDCFDIDCAETIDGRLLVFEAGAAMLTHVADPSPLHPYNPPSCVKMSAALVRALTARCAQPPADIWWRARTAGGIGAPQMAAKSVHADHVARFW